MRNFDRSVNKKENRSRCSPIFFENQNNISDVSILRISILSKTCTISLKRHLPILLFFELIILEIHGNVLVYFSRIRTMKERDSAEEFLRRRDKHKLQQSAKEEIQNEERERLFEEKSVERIDDQICIVSMK